MPTIQGYTTRTHQLSGNREIDILHKPGDYQLWASTQQVGRLTGLGGRKNNSVSDTDLGGKNYHDHMIMVPDPHKIYVPKRGRKAWLISAEGLIKRTFHVYSRPFASFCAEFIAVILPEYPEFAARNIELIAAWSEILPHVGHSTCRRATDAFAEAVADRDARLATYPDATPILVLLSSAERAVFCRQGDTSRYVKVPLDGPDDLVTYAPERLREAEAQAREHQLKSTGSRYAACLALAFPDTSVGMVTSQGLKLVAAGRPVAEPEPAPHGPQERTDEVPPEVDRPLPGLPALFGDQPCPTYGSYEDPQWIGLYVCEALGIVDHKQALARIPAEEKGVVLYTTPQGGGVQPHITIKEPGLYRLIGESRKPEAERFKTWLYRDVLPAIRKHGRYVAPGAQPGGLSAVEQAEAMREIVQEVLPGIVAAAIKAHLGNSDIRGGLNLLVDVEAHTLGRLDKLVEEVRSQGIRAGEQIALTAQQNALLEQQNGLLEQLVQVIMASRPVMATAREYIAMDGVAEALRKAPALKTPSFGLDAIRNRKQATLWMKKLCDAERRKVVARDVERLEAKVARKPMPPAYLPVFVMEPSERDGVRVILFNPACWVHLKGTFKITSTPTLLFPGPKAEPKPSQGDEDKATGGA